MANGFQTATVWVPGERGFRMGVVQPAGRVVHLTGQVAWDANAHMVGRGDAAAQTRQCFENIAALLDRVGGRLGDIVSLTTYLIDRADLADIQRVRADVFDAGTAPVSTSVVVAGLGHEDFLVELTPIAVVPDDRFIAPE